MDAGTITYSRGQLRDVTTAPTVYRSEIWQVHLYVHADHRTTWDISDGKVIACYTESFRKLPRRSHSGWCHDEDITASVPITL